MPQAPLSVWSWVATRALVTLCAFVLLIASSPVSHAEAATELGNQISSGRRGQSYYESAMLAQDAVIGRIRQQTKATSRALKGAKRAVTRSKRALRIATAVVQQRSARLAELEALLADTPVEQTPEGYDEKLRMVRKELDRAKARRQLMGTRDRAALRMRGARQYRLNALRRQRRAAVARRESAEGGLAAYIVQLTRLAQERAEIQSEVRLSISGAGFTWPAVGRIAQTYGCTGFYLNPRRGSCRHFHDGLDIVSGYGSRVSSAADGVVAYAGWNPWDEGGRAWVMVVSHPDGYVTRYGHMLPTSLVRVGEFVRQGQAIGKMGNTGQSTGTHLHFELLRGGTTVSPWSYLPEGMVTIKVKDSKHAAKQAGKSKSARAKAARGKAAAGKAARAARGKAARAADAEHDAQAARVEPGVADVSVWTVAQVSDRSASSAPSDENVSDPGPGVCRTPDDVLGGTTSRSPDESIAAGHRPSVRVDAGDGLAAVEEPCAIPAATRGLDDSGEAARADQHPPDVSVAGTGLERGMSLTRRGTSPLPE